MLLIASFMLFRPDWYMNRMYPEYVPRPVTELYTVATYLPDNGRFVAKIRGMNLEGNDLTKLVAVNLPALEPHMVIEKTKEQEVGKERLRRAGLTFMQLGETIQVANVRFGTQAARASWEQGWDVIDVMVPNPERPSDEWIFIPGFFLIGMVWLMQGRRIRKKMNRL